MIPWWTIGTDREHWQTAYSFNPRDLLGVVVESADLITEGENEGRYRFACRENGDLLLARHSYNVGLRRRVREIMGEKLKEVPGRTGQEKNVSCELLSFEGGIRVGASVCKTSKGLIIDNWQLRISLPGAKIKMTARDQEWVIDVPPRENYRDQENPYDFDVQYPDVVPDFAK